MKLYTYAENYKHIAAPIYILPRLTLKKTQEFMRIRQVRRHCIVLQFDFLKLLAGIELSWEKSVDYKSAAQ